MVSGPHSHGGAKMKNSAEHGHSPKRVSAPTALWDLEGDLDWKPKEPPPPLTQRSQAERACSGLSRTAGKRAESRRLVSQRMHAARRKPQRKLLAASALCFVFMIADLAACAPTHHLSFSFGWHRAEIIGALLSVFLSGSSQVTPLSLSHNQLSCMLHLSASWCTWSPAGVLR